MFRRRKQARHNAASVPTSEAVNGADRLTHARGETTTTPKQSDLPHTPSSTASQDDLKDWRSSAARESARAKRSRLGLPGTLLIYIGIAAALFRENIAQEINITEATALLLGSTLAVIGLAMALYGASQYQNERASFFEEAERRARGEFIEALDNITDTDDLVSLIQANRKRMLAYDAIARRQAAASYRSSQIAMGTGLLVLSVGILIAILSDNPSTKYTAAFLTAVGAAVGGYISRTFITVQQGAMLQMNYYFQQPLVQSYLLTAERLAGKLDPPERTSALTGIVTRIIDDLDLLMTPRDGSRPAVRRTQRKSQEAAATDE